MKLFKIWVVFFLSLFVVCVNAAAGVESENYIRIKSTTPSSSKKLKEGDRISFVIVIEYSMAKTNGRVGLIIKSVESVGEPLLREFLNVNEKSGTVTIKGDVVVPKTSMLELYTPLYTIEGGNSSVVDSLVFEVIK